MHLLVIIRLAEANYDYSAMCATGEISVKHFYEKITPRLKDFIERQKMFFVATAPLSEDGHINLSPKGYDTFRILDTNTVAYLDLCGSGAETIAHVKENKRIVIMFCAFEGPPKIIRLYGRASVISQTTDEYRTLINQFPDYSGIRTIIKLDVTRISGSCGFSVPFYKFVSERDQLEEWAKKKGKEWLTNYQKENNCISIDGICALDSSGT